MSKITATLVIIQEETPDGHIALEIDYSVDIPPGVNPAVEPGLVLGDRVYTVASNLLEGLRMRMGGTIQNDEKSYF